MKKLKDLQYNVCRWENGKIETFNVFQHSGVLLSAAKYRLGEFDKHREEWVEYNKERGVKPYCDYWHDLAMWLFGDFWSRYEYEFGFGDAFKKDDGSWEGEKTDIYTVFCEPNIRLLKAMIDEVSVSSCKQYIREWNKAHGRYRRKNAS